MLKKWEKQPYFSGSQAKQSKFSAGLNQDQQWVILGEHGVSAPVLQNNGSQYYQLYHPGILDESISVRNIVNSSVQRAQEKGVTCVKVDFFYYVMVITSGEDQSSYIIMRCNPVWNTTETMQSRQMQRQCSGFVIKIMNTKKVSAVGKKKIRE